MTGGPSGSTLADFEPLQDCFRYDDQDQEQAGLMAEYSGDLRDPNDHPRCA